ncbi:MAG TPA: ribosome small subunit-dependent GTPase A [Tepidisphaeraceae bacterium]|jgi:ribosome biogenesis GTPase
MGRRKAAREKDLTSRYLDGELEEDRMPQQQRFTDKAKSLQQNKIVRTAQMRAEEELGADLESLPVGLVMQVFSRYCQVEHEGKTYLCEVRKTMNKLAETRVVVGDLVRFRLRAAAAENQQAEGTIEQALPRKTVVTRADSFKGQLQQPIVANADQMLIVASVREPRIKWGLIDRMVIAGLTAGLAVVICLNKSDLLPAGEEDAIEAAEILAYFQTLGVRSLSTSVISGQGLEALRGILRDHVTLLGGHSGVGKSSLIGAVEPGLDLRVAALSGYSGKGRHTTTTARLYHLTAGGSIIDTPGVKLFGLWNVNAERLAEFYPDVENDTAPEWRKESYQRILNSL